MLCRIICHPTDVTFPPLPPAEAGTRFSNPGGTQGWVYLGTAIEVRSPYPKLHIAVAIATNTTVCCEIRTWILSHALSTRPLRLAYTSCREVQAATVGHLTTGITVVVCRWTYWKLGSNKVASCLQFSLRTNTVIYEFGIFARWVGVYLLVNYRSTATRSSVAVPSSPRLYTPPPALVRYANRPFGRRRRCRKRLVIPLLDRVEHRDIVSARCSRLRVTWLREISREFMTSPAGVWAAFMAPALAGCDTTQPLMESSASSRHCSAFVDRKRQRLATVRVPRGEHLMWQAGRLMQKYVTSRDWCWSDAGHRGVMECGYRSAWRLLVTTVCDRNWRLNRHTVL